MPLRSRDYFCSRDERGGERVICEGWRREASSLLLLSTLRAMLCFYTRHDGVGQLNKGLRVKEIQRGIYIYFVRGYWTRDEAVPFESAKAIKWRGIRVDLFVH